MIRRAAKRLADVYKDEHSVSCVYCGAPASTWDHVPPLDAADRLGSNRFLKLVRYRACGQCDGWLGNRPFYDLENRRKWVKRKLQVLVEKSKKSARWTDEEISQLGPVLASSMEENRLLATSYRKRLSRVCRELSSSENPLGKPIRY